MPYIKREARPAIDKLVKPLLDHLRKLPIEEQDGSVNYAITRILRGLYPLTYFHQNRLLGVLEAVKLEHYRRRLGPYEDQKISESGDVQ